MSDCYFDNLSDVELRRELQKYGFPVMPVTKTTRSLLIKKLKSHVLNDSSSHKSTSIKKPSLQPSKNSSNRQLSPARRSNPSPSRRQKIPSSYITNNKNINDISAATIQSNSNRDFYLSSDGRSYLNRDNGNFADDRTLESRQTLGDNGYSFSFGNSKTVNPIKKSSPRIYVPPPILSNDINCNSSWMGNTRPSRETDRTPLRNGKESPGVVSRLLKLRDITIGRSHTNSSYTPTTPKYFYISDSDSDNGSPIRCPASLKKKPNNSIANSMWRHLNIRSRFKQSSVPYLLISCFGLFFLILAVLYITKPPDMPSTMLEKSTTFTLCEEIDGHMSSFSKPSINCIDNELLAPSLAFNKELIQLLQTNIEKHYCRDRSVSPEITGTEFMKYLYKKRSTDAHKLLKSFHAALYLIEHNPQWKIKIHSKNDNQQRLPDIYKQNIRFGLLKPYLPLKCILFNKMQRFLVIIGSVFLIGLLMGIAFVLRRFWNQRRQMRVKAVENITKEIVKELIQRASYEDETQGEVIINQLRDKLIPLNKRKSLLWAWNEALQKLEAIDIRVQFGCILQNGEEFRTMKWVEPTIPAPFQPITSTPSSLATNLHQDNPDPRLKKKHWQSPAFDNVNKINDPPTPCLKIRHMFDASEANLPDLKQNIIESILEKVGPQCRIFDIQLDRQSCCVYIRCASEKDAGTIHNEINGWWFDNRLVSIKFLRLQRYLVRFPNSTSIVPITIKNFK